MNSGLLPAAISRETRSEQGFLVYRLRNEHLSLEIVPELGARVISLKDERTHREWMWHPASGLKLFRNARFDDFSRSPLVGIDECLPTIAPCRWRERNLPDHGEVWSAGWSLEEAAWSKGILRTSVDLEISPFALARQIEVEGNRLRFTYCLTNRNSEPEPYIWAMHPLIRVCAGDRLVLPSATRAALENDTWTQAVDSVIPEGGCSKLFAGPLAHGLCALENQKTGERLQFQWEPASNNALGLWLTRGGWHGHHHFAMEPTNADADSLAVAAEHQWCGQLPGGATSSWWVELQVG